MFGALALPPPPPPDYAMLAAADRQEFIRSYVLSTVKGQGGLTRTQLQIIRDNASDMYDIMYGR